MSIWCAGGWDGEAAVRILIVNDFGYVVGGAAAVALNSALGLAAAGHEVLFFCAVGPADPRLAVAGVKVTLLGRHDLLGNPSRLRAAMHGLWDAGVASALGELLATLDPANTIVHLHTWVKSLSVSVVPEIKGRGFTLTVTLHDFFTVCPNGGLYDYQRQEICHRQPLSLSCVLCNCDARSALHKGWRVLRQWIQKGPGGMPDGVDAWISVSRRSGQILRPLLPAGIPMYFVPNPVDVPAAPVAPREPSSAFLFVGRLSPEKGGDLLAMAARQAGVAVSFVGSGEAQGPWQVLNPEAHFCGWLDREATMAQMRAALAVVFPSRWYETQGLVVAEAAALGVPVIVADCTVAAEQVVDGKTGRLFAGGNVADLARQLRWFADHPDLAAQMGRQAAADYWAAPSGMPQHVEALEAAYVRIQHDRPATPA